MTRLLPLVALVLVALFVAIAVHAARHPRCTHGESSMAIAFEHGQIVTIQPVHTTGCTR